MLRTVDNLIYKFNVIPIKIKCSDRIKDGGTRRADLKFLGHLKRKVMKGN